MFEIIFISFDLISYIFTLIKNTVCTDEVTMGNATSMRH